jgi:hypothetical protein
MAVWILVVMLGPVARAETTEGTRACVPACRDGYVCIDGACVSACNPPCADDERCVGRGVCERRDQHPAAVAPTVAPSNPTVPPGSPTIAPTSPVAPTALASSASPIASVPPIAALAIPQSPSAESNVALHVNLLGLLELGPTAALELGGKTASLSFRFRAINAGALSYVIVADSSSGEVLEFSYGIAAALRIYTGVRGNMRGFFWGPALEFVHTRVVDDESVGYTTELIIPELELGYRWAFGHFLVEVGGGIGYGIVTKATTEPLSEGGSYASPNEAENGANALGTVSVGTFF